MATISFTNDISTYSQLFNVMNTEAYSQYPAVAATCPIPQNTTEIHVQIESNSPRYKDF